MKVLICYLKAIPLYFRTGVWSPHLYKEISREQKIVISTGNRFRISDNLNHTKNEQIHPKATVIKRKCKYCDYEDIYWYDRDPKKR